MKFGAVFIICFTIFMYGGKGFGVEGSQATLHECHTVLRITPKIDISSLFRQNQKEKLSITSSLKHFHNEKGCGRDTHDPITVYRNCGIKKTVPILPIYSAPQESYVKYLPTETTLKGGIDYVFDGSTAVRYPTKRLPSSWFNSYTITSWIYVDIHPERQYILSWSDGDSPRKEYTGFYVARRDDGKHLNFGFHHTHIDQLTGEECQIKKKWRLRSHDIKWNFISLSFDGCDVEVTVDGHTLFPTSGKLNFHLPERHIQPKFVIGARWAGSLLKYSDYMHGKMSGLMLTTEKVGITDNLICIIECQEKLKISSRLPVGMKEINGGNSLSVEGLSEQVAFEEFLKNIIYVNTAHHPAQQDREISIEVLNQVTKKTVKSEVEIHIRRKPSVIVLQGDCSGYRNSLLKQGVKLCKRMKIFMTGCEQVLDSLIVHVKPQMSAKEKIFIPPPYLKRHGLSLAATETGFVVFGAAMVTQYAELLYHIKYSYSGFLAGELSRTVVITLSARNRQIISDDFEVSFKASMDGIVMLPSNKLDSSGHVVDAVVEGSESKQAKVVMKRIAHKSNKSTQPYVVWLVLACVFSCALAGIMIGYGYKMYKNNGNLVYKKASVEGRNSTASEYFWDESGLPMRLTINPSERVSITNDPYADIIMKQPESSTTEDSVFSEDDETEFDADSIRQLEWDSLEDSLDAILEEERQSNENKAKEKMPKERKLKRDHFNKEAFL